MFPVSTSSVSAAVGVASATFDLVLEEGRTYLYTCDVASWLCQGESPTATAGAGSMYVPAGERVDILGQLGAALAVIRDDGDGTASLTRCVARL